MLAWWMDSAVCACSTCCPAWIYSICFLQEPVMSSMPVQGILTEMCGSEGVLGMFTLISNFLFYYVCQEIPYCCFYFLFCFFSNQSASALHFQWPKKPANHCRALMMTTDQKKISCILFRGKKVQKFAGSNINEGTILWLTGELTF